MTTSNDEGLTALRDDLVKACDLIEGLLAQFDHTGCTCTFPSKECCSYARAVYFNAAALKARAKLEQSI